jgi:hypothetical protein
VALDNAPRLRSAISSGRNQPRKYCTRGANPAQPSVSGMRSGARIPT